ncbi:hypothetical protein N2152v2_009437 [Parachlorella kessleri]
MTSRIAFLGVDSMAGFETLTWWGRDRTLTKDIQQEAKPDRVDVFGVGRRGELNGRLATGPNGTGYLAADEPSWLHLPPQYYDRVITDSLRAGKAVFVESLEHLDGSKLQQMAELAANGPLLMTGLYQRFDKQLIQAAEAGIENMVGKPLLYQAHASSLNDSLFDLGMQHVDAVRFLLRSEPQEVFAAGSSMVLSQCQVLTLTLKLQNGVVALLALDKSGTSAQERVLVVGDASRAEFVGDLRETKGLTARVLRLQKAGITHFVQAVLEGASPRVDFRDALRAHAVMAAAAESLHTGAAVAVGQARGQQGPLAASTRRLTDWVGQVAGKVAEVAAGAPTQEDSGSAQQAGTPPRSSDDRPAKAGHLRGTALATTTPDSPDLLTMHQ